MRLSQTLFLGNTLRFMTPRSFCLWLLIGFSGAASHLAAQAPAELPPAVPTPITTASVAPKDDDWIDGMKLNDAPIDLVLQRLEDWTGRTVLRPQQLPTPTITINLQRRVPKSEAILALETLMNLNGIGIIPVGDKFLKVVDLPRARMEAPQMIEGSALDLPPSGQVMSKLFQLEFQRVSEFMPQINMLLNGNMGGYVVFEKSNAALITDSVSTLQRIELLLKKTDQPLTSGMNPKFYQLKFGAKASDVVNKINAIVQGPLQNQLGASTKFSADDRTNQIVLLSDPRQYPFFDDLIAKLDVKADPNTRNEVIYLKHAAAKDVAQLLSNLVTGQSKSTQSGNSVRPNQFIRPNGPNPGEAPPPAAPVPPAMSNMALDPGASTNEFSGLLDIQADERSNAVVVSGTVDDIRLLKELVDKIDVLLPQVRIDVVIAEVALTHNETSGINSLGISVDGSRITGASVSVAGLSADGKGAPVSGVLKHDATGGFTTLNSLTAVLTPLKNKGKVEFLSRPTLVTTHNKEATIQVTQKQPIITGIQRAATTAATTQVSDAFNTSSSVTYQDIGIQLKVKPLIGVDNKIQLDIDQIVDDIIGTVTIDNNQQPIIGHREAKSFVNVASDEMIVLGGLQRHKNTVSKGRFGIFYELPLVGWLLGPRSKDIERTELLVFIQPHVIRPEENVSDTNMMIDKQAGREVIKNFIDPTPPPETKPIEEPKPTDGKKPAQRDDPISMKRPR